MTDMGTQQAPIADARWDLGRLLLALLLAPLAVGVMWTALSVLWHWPQPVYRLTFTRVLVTWAACGLALTGCRLLLERRHAGLAIAGLLLPCLWVLSVISFIGVVTLPIALILTVVLIGVSRAAGGGLGESSAIGLLVAVALAVLLFAQPWQKTVDCGGGVVSTSSRFGDSSFSGGGTGAAVAADGTQDAGGMIRIDEATWTYRCEGDRLAEFRRVD